MEKVGLRKGSPKYKSLQGCSFECLTKRAVYKTETSHIHTGFGDFRESHPKTASQIRAFLSFSARLSPEHDTVIPG